MSETVYDRKILELNMALPAAPQPAGSYQPVVISGNLAYLSGQLSRLPDGNLMTGRAGKEADKKKAQEAAHAAALNLIAAIKGHIGFNRFVRIVKLTGFVQVDPSFNEISAVVNSASDLLGLVFGAHGVHARTSVGVAALPQNALVELDAIVEVKA